MKPRVHPNALEAIRPKTIRPKANRPKMVQNNGTIAYIFSKTTPNPTPNWGGSIRPKPIRPKERMLKFSKIMLLGDMNVP